MNLFSFMFSSPYDQASLAVMAIGLLVNLALDLTRDRRGGS
jgi:hypothetical protein